jgi:hypothetical protein
MLYRGILLHITYLFLLVIIRLTYKMVNVGRNM